MKGELAQTVRVWIGLGSNLGDRRAFLEGAVEALRELDGLDVRRVSAWYSTEPVDAPQDSPSFLNGVLEADSRLGPAELLLSLQAIERGFGREREGAGPNAPRTLDLDLLLFGEERVRSADLVVPHPRMEERIFVLEPLASLAPELFLFGCGRTVRERLAALRGERVGSAQGDETSAGGGAR